MWRNIPTHCTWNLFVLLGFEPSKTRSFPIKTRVIWVSGLYYVYIYIYIFVSYRIWSHESVWLGSQTKPQHPTLPTPAPVFIRGFFPNFLVVGFNPFETYKSKWEFSPNRGEHKNIYLKPPTSFSWCKRRVAFHGTIPLHQGFVKCVFFWVPVHPALFDKKNPRGFQLYTPENQDGTKKKHPGWKGKSSSKPPLLGFMLIFQGVNWKNAPDSCVPTTLRGDFPDPWFFQVGFVFPVASRWFLPRHCERSSTFCLLATAVSHESNLQEAKVSN